MRFRVIATLAVLIAAVGVLVAGVGSAAAKQPQPGQISTVDPQYTNIPYLAWAGSTVKVSRCIGIGAPEVSVESVGNYGSQHGFNDILQAEYQQMIWTGDADTRPSFTGTASGTAAGDLSRIVDAAWDYPGGGICWSTYLTSDKAGWLDLKFSITLDLDAFFKDLRISDPSIAPLLVFEDDVPVAWMLDSAPTLTESGDVGDYKVGDPGGSGSFEPILGADGKYHLYPGLIQATVTGTFPIGDEYVTDYTGTALGNGTITLPNDWPWLANHFAEDASLAGSAYGGAAANDWDIHDDNTAAEGHILPDSGCGDDAAATESVDNCVGSGPDPDLGPFSSIFGLVGTQNDAWGPFDPIRGFETLLSDGNLTADDAPMPALEVDVAITNSGSLGAVGNLSKADKSLIFNRNTPTYGGTDQGVKKNGKPYMDLGDPHMLYAPFYKALIPAVSPLDIGNGTSGVLGTFNGDFREYLTLGGYPGPTSNTLDPGQYDYWDTYTFGSEGGDNQCNDVTGNAISQPYGSSEVAVYTDEHGQAYVQFNPANDDGEGIVLQQQGNNICDVYNGSLTGTADIQAVTVYPGEPPADPANHAQKLSNPLTKTVKFTPLKVLNCVPKADQANTAYCVETVTDFEGNPVKAEVEFTVEPSGTVIPDSNPYPCTDNSDPTTCTYDPSGQVVQKAPDNHTFAVIWTSPSTGEAAVDVHESTGACVNVTAENVGTEDGGMGITRDFDFNPKAGTACGSNTGGGSTTTTDTTPTTTTTAQTSGTGSTPQAQSAPVVLANVTAPAPTVQAPAATAPKTTKKLVKVTLVSAHVVSTKNGRYLTVRVNSKAKTAVLRITLINKKGAKHIVLRKVRTNHVVRVGNLKLAPSVKTVRVALV